ncbi:MAG: DNA recombination protein RmuC [Deltaproteobacteria bacterium]|nr:DNA recombination protein RmuC [Deltaproteobacteria bacterium]
MSQVLLYIVVALQIGLFAALAVLIGRFRRPDLTDVVTRIDRLGSEQQRSERALREELGRSRTEATDSARHARTELASSLKGFGDSLQTRMAEMAQMFAKLTQVNETKLEGLRTAVDDRLGLIQRDNAERLEQMRATVDEKLQGTLERRLGESFQQVSDRLERVHQGLGEMQNLATGVGDLKRVLSNVKVRGGWGEVQLGALLEQILSPEQYERNVRTREGRNEVVEFAIKLPGPSSDQRDRGDVVWLPVDSKFPLEDYQRLVDASCTGDAEQVEAAAKALERVVTCCAKDVAEKYLNPPATTDFAVLFLPTEGLYAEIVRRNGLVESLQRDHRVVVAGPSTFAALLNSLRVGFRTLAIQERSSEVWKLLGAVKAEFGKFGDLLDGVKKKLDQASSTMEDAARKSRTIERKLRGVEELPSAEAGLLLEDVDDDTVRSRTASPIRIVRS